MPKTKYSHSDVSGEPFHHSPGAAAGVGGGAGPSEGPARPPGEAQVGPVHSGPRGGAPHLADAHVRTLRVGVGITPSFSPRVPQSQPVSRLLVSSLALAFLPPYMWAKRGSPASC